MKKHRILICALILAVLGGMAVWAGGEQEAGPKAVPAETEAGPGDIDVGISFASKQTIFYQQAEDMLKQAAKNWEQETGRKMNITVTVADADVARQAANIEDLIARQPDIILMVPQDSKAIVASIKAAHRAGIKAMTFIRAASPDAEEPADAHVGLDTINQAYVAGRYLLKMMEDDGVEPKIIHVIGDLRDENAVNRQLGFEKAVREFDATILTTVPSEWNPDKALSGLSAALQAYPDANALFVASDFLLGAVQTACERVGKWAPYGEPNHMYHANVDVQPNALVPIEQGYIDVNTLWDHYKQGIAAVETIAALVDGQTLPTTEILVKPRIVTPENIASMENISSRNYQ